MSHARRKFNDALKNDKDMAESMLKKIQLIYEVKSKTRDQEFSFEQRKVLRGKEAVPILKEIEQRLKEEINKVTPKSAIGIAIAYILRLWP